MEPAARRLTPADITSQACRCADFPTHHPTRLSMVNQRHGPLYLPRPPIGDNARRWYRNINLLSIAYACRPRLRSRLTLGRLALPRKPWAFGGGVSRSSFVTHTGILSSQASTAGLSPPLPRHGNAPLPIQACSLNPTASVASLSPVTLSAQEHLTSELLRFL